MARDSALEESGDDPICLTKAELREVARQSARDALREVGLEGDDAAKDVRDLRSLIEAYRSAKKTAWQTFVKMITTAAFAALLTGISIKLGVWGPPR